MEVCVLIPRSHLPVPTPYPPRTHPVPTPYPPRTHPVPTPYWTLCFSMVNGSPSSSSTPPPRTGRPGSCASSGCRSYPLNYTRTRGFSIDMVVFYLVLINKVYSSHLFKVRRTSVCLVLINKVYSSRLFKVRRTSVCRDQQAGGRA